MASEYKRPLPTVKPWTAPFWKAASEGKLILQKGTKSGKYVMYPKKYSPHDYTEELIWEEASGKGTIYSFTKVVANAPSMFSEELPYTVAVVDLEEGVRICTNIIDSDDEVIKIGAKVEAIFETVAKDIGLVKFKVVD